MQEREPAPAAPGGPRHAWYVACASRELREAPLARTVLGTPVVLFRGEGGTAAALLDRCAHRNVPLSLGRAAQGGLECGYHGWRYDRGGRCVEVPGLVEETGGGARAVPALATVEQDGFVWVWGEPGEQPRGTPFRLPRPGPGYRTVRQAVDFEGGLLAVLENALDVPHTAFLHRGLFRGAGARHRIVARVRRGPDGVEAEYVGEPRPSGLAGRVLAPSGGVVTHFDRFILPSIAQVEYRLGERTHLLTTSLCTPQEAGRTRLHAVVCFRTVLPGWLLEPLLRPIALRILRQDAAVVKAQSDSVRRFGGERYASTSIDVLGLQIAALLRRAESGAEAAPEEAEWSREVVLEV